MFPESLIYFLVGEIRLWVLSGAQRAVGKYSRILASSTPFPTDFLQQRAKVIGCIERVPLDVAKT